MTRKHLWIGLACCLVLTGCSQKGPVDPASETETPELDAQARMAATELAHEKFPTAIINGVWVTLTGKPQNGYYGAVDVGSGPQRKRVEIIIRRFTSPENKTYWHADTYSRERLSIYGNSSASTQPEETQTTNE